MACYVTLRHPVSELNKVVVLVPSKSTDQAVGLAAEMVRLVIKSAPKMQ